MYESKWLKEKEQLEQWILVDKLSYEEIGRRYGCSGSNIKRVATRLEIELPQRRTVNPKETFQREKKLCTCLNCGKEFVKHSSSYGIYCSNACQQEYRHKQKYQDFLLHPENYARANYQPKLFKPDIIAEQNGVCAICGMKPEWNGKPLVFILDHIDRHASHNERSNLRCICPNCDSQLDTYKSKNKCGERSYYRYHKEDSENKIGK